MSPKALGWLGAATSVLGIVLMFLAWRFSRSEAHVPGITETVAARAARALMSPDEAHRFGRWLADTSAPAEEIQK